MKTVIHYKWGEYLPVTETWIYAQINNLKKYKPVIYCANTLNLDIYPTRIVRSLELKRGIKNPAVFFHKAANRMLKLYPKFFISLFKDKPHLIHAHFGDSGYNFLRLKKIFKLPLITTFYAIDLSALVNEEPAWRLRYKKLFKEGEKFLVEGSHMKKCLTELGCPEEKITIQHLGVDLGQIKFVPRKLNHDEEIKILISARFIEKKGIPFALEAFRRLKQRRPELKLKLTVIGDSDGSPEAEKERRKILAIIKKYNLEKNVNLLGFQPHSIFIKELYNHHILLQPSIRATNGDIEGGLPVSITEAACSGMPVLSTNHCDIPEVVINYESGYLVPERDIRTLAEKLDFLVSNPNIWPELGLRARKHIQENYNINKQVRLLEEIYDKVLGKFKDENLKTIANANIRPFWQK